MSEHDERIGLSAAGEARRAAMLGELGAEMERVRVGRVRRRRAVVGVCVVGVVAVGVWMGVRTGGPNGNIAVQPVQPEPVVEQDEVRSIVTRFAGAHTLDVVREAGHGVTTELVVGRAGIERAGDSVLLAELDRMGRPTGLIRRGGAVYLTASVARIPQPSVEGADEPGA